MIILHKARFVGLIKVLLLIILLLIQRTRSVTPFSVSGQPAALHEAEEALE